MYIARATRLVSRTILCGRNQRVRAIPIERLHDVICVTTVIARTRLFVCDEIVEKMRFSHVQSIDEPTPQCQRHRQRVPRRQGREGHEHVSCVIADVRRPGLGAAAAPADGATARAWGQLL